MATEVEALPDVLTVRNGWKSYGNGNKKMRVLKNFEMTVKQGTIYALLGASGCGKTTLLTCLVDQQELDFGTILAFGFKPGTKECGIPGSRLGYMPQEIGLHMECSIQEMITYFGIINGMTSEDIELRMSFLVKLMQLPNRNRIIHTLSGGQQRRVSFCVALLHEPEMLILDEPTVGVDPLLRQMLWSYLRELSTVHKTTVILTTHYIEEARQAQMIGMMRSGRLLAEDSPDSLLTRYQSRSLESVFLQLCVLDDKGSNYQQAMAVDGAEQDGRVILKRNNTDTAAHGTEWRPKRQARPFVDGLRATLYKDATRVRRNLFLFLIIFIQPAMIMLMICIFVGQDPKNLTFAVVNNEWPTDPICQSDENNCNFQNLSCTFLRNLDKNMINLVPFNDEASAIDSIRRGHAWGFFSFPANYSEGVKERLLNVTAADNDTRSLSVVKIRMDMTNAQITLIVQHMISRNIEASLGRTNCGEPNHLASMPVKFGNAIYGSDNPNFQEFIAPGILIFAIFGAALSAVAGKIVYEQSSGCPQRAAISGLDIKTNFIGHILWHLVLCVVHVTSTVSLIYMYVDVSEPHSWMWLSCVVFMQGILGFCFGYFVSLLVSGIASLVGLLFAIILPNFYISGALWPLEGISQKWFRWACGGGFSTLATDSARSIISRGWTLTHSGVWPGLLATALWSMVFTLGVFAYPKFVKLQFPSIKSIGRKNEYTTRQ